MAKVILENTANGFFTINGVPYQKSEVQFFPSWEGSDRMNIQQYHGELLWGLLHFSDVALADGTTFGSVAEIIEWADSNAFGGGGGGSKVFDTSGDFPNPGKEGILYIDSSDDSMWYWDGTQYVQFASVKQFANFSGFPATGNPGYLYIDRAGLASYYWNGSTYIQLTGPGTFIRNQNLLAQAANFWISGSGRIEKGLVITAPQGTQGLKVFTNYGDIGGDLQQLELSNIVQNGRVWFTMSGAPSAGAFHLQLFSKPDLGIYSNRAFLQGEKGFAFLAGDGNGVPGPFYFGSGGINDPVTLWLSAARNVIAGSAADNGARLQVQGGVFSLAAATSDFPVINGGMFFRSDLMKIRAGVNGIWQNLLTEVQTAGVMHVNPGHPAATDSRAGLNVYSFDTPFRTIQAAVTAAPYGATIQVYPATYNEGVVVQGNWITIKLMAGVLINGGAKAAIRVASSTQIVLLMDYYTTLKANGTEPTIASDLNNCGIVIHGPLSGVEFGTQSASFGYYNFFPTIYSENGVALQGIRYTGFNGSSCAGVRIVSNNGAQVFDQVDGLAHCMVEGPNGAGGPNCALFNCFFNTKLDCLLDIGSTLGNIDRCSFYSQTGNGLTSTNNNPSQSFRIRNSTFNVYGQAIYAQPNPTYVFNVQLMNVWATSRNPAVVNTIWINDNGSGGQGVIILSNVVTNRAVLAPAWAQQFSVAIVNDPTGVFP